MHRTALLSIVAILLTTLTLIAGVPQVAAMPDITASGQVWQDRNCDGVRQDDEPSVLNQPIWLFAAGQDGQINTADDQVVEYGSSGNVGQYLFTVGTTGVDYALVILPVARPATQIPAPLHTGGDTTKDNDLRSDIWATDGFQMNASQTVTGIDVGFCANPDVHLIFTPLVRR
jgi:hypothetical protein